jgi:hypothetical protein
MKTTPTALLHNQNEKPNTQPKIIVMKRSRPNAEHDEEIIETRNERISEFVLDADRTIEAIINKGGDEPERLWTTLRSALVLNGDGTLMSNKSALVVCQICDLITASEAMLDLWRITGGELGIGGNAEKTLYFYVKEEDHYHEIPWLLTNPIEESQDDTPLHLMRFIKSTLQTNKEVQGMFDELDLIAITNDVSMIIGALEFLVGAMALKASRKNGKTKELVPA